MFLELDKKDPQKIAAIDSNERKCTYGEIVDFSESLGKLIPKRSLVMLLCQNTVPALLVYLGCIVNKIVPMLVSASADGTTVNVTIEDEKEGNAP